MKLNLFIPKKINVGFQERKDTYTKRLAYIIYYDEKGVLRKEKSWQSWRDDRIPNEEYDNVPISGFVLNKKAGGYKSGWDYRQSYIRVYDPRGFEFEITIENLLYILENCNSIKGKGLEGEFIYSWSGTDLVLLPVDSPDYQNVLHYNEKIINAEKITNKNLICGATYRRKKDNIELLYLGKYEEYGWDGDSFGFKHMFAEMKEGNFFNLETMDSVNGKFIETVSTVQPSNFDDIIERLMHHRYISPPGKKVKKYIDLNTIKSVFGKTWCYRFSIMYEEDGKIRIVDNISHTPNEAFIDKTMGDFDENEKIIISSYEMSDDNRYRETRKEEVTTLKEFFDTHNPYTYYEYLANGRLHYSWISDYYNIFDNVEDLYSEDMRIDVE